MNSHCLRAAIAATAFGLSALAGSQRVVGTLAR